MSQEDKIKELNEGWAAAYQNLKKDFDIKCAENAKLRGLLQNIVEAHNSPAASGGEMWYAEAMSDAVEKVIAALAETKTDNL